MRLSAPKLEYGMMMLLIDLIQKNSDGFQTHRYFDQ